MSVNIFARWNSEDECLQEMLGLHDEESARAIVAGIRQRVSSNTLFKSFEGEIRVISKADDDEIIVYGPCSWEKVDPENDLITASAMSRFFNKWFNVVPERYRNVMLMHKNFQAGEPLLKYQGSDGQMYYTHVHEKGAMLVSKIRDDDGLAQTKDLRQKVRDNVYKSYSISGMPVDVEKKMQDDRLINIIKDIDPSEVTICVTGMNDMAKFDVIKAEDLRYSGAITATKITVGSIAGAVSSNCVCPECGATVSNPGGVHCPEIACPKCGASMRARTPGTGGGQGQGGPTYDEKTLKAAILAVFSGVSDEEFKALLQKPFAQWRDMDHCIRSVSARKDPPKDPAAYCASIMHQVEGKTEEDKPSDNKSKSYAKRSNAMDERTLETALKVREIFKELEHIE